jgi:hypothetical protein
MGREKLQVLYTKGGVLVRSLKFAVVMGLAAAAWAAGADMFFYLPLVGAGAIVGLLCTTTATWPRGWKNVASAFVAIFFSVEGAALYLHAQTESDSGPVARIAIAPPHVPSLLTLFMTDTTGNDELFDSAATLPIGSPHGSDDVRLFITNVVSADSNSRFVRFYIPSSPLTFEVVDFIIRNMGTFTQLEKMGIATRRFGSSSMEKSADAPFSGTAVIYHESMFSDQETVALNTSASQAMISLDLRGLDYAQSVWVSILEGRTKQPPDYEIKNGAPDQVGAPIHQP